MFYYVNKNKTNKQTKKIENNKEILLFFGDLKNKIQQKKPLQLFLLFFHFFLFHIIYIENLFIQKLLDFIFYFDQLIIANFLITIKIQIHWNSSENLSNYNTYLLILASCRLTVKNYCLYMDSC